MNPFPYQIECINEIDWLEGRVLLGLDPGLGKTFTTTLWLSVHPEAFPVVVVCPSSVKYVWEREVKRTLKIKATVLEGRTGGIVRGSKVVIVNYDVLHIQARRGRKKGRPGRLDQLKKFRPKTIIIDECQYLLSFNSKRTRAVTQLCRGRPHVLALSGTPLLNKPIELYSTIHLLRPDVFPSRLAYADRYCEREWTPWGWKADGAIHLDELHRKLVSSCLVRRRKVDVLKELPKKVRAIVPIPLSDSREYDRANLDFLDWLGEIDPAAARRAARAEAISKVGHLLRLCIELKMPAMIEWIDDFLFGGEKLVVFTRHRWTIEQLQKPFHKHSIVIDGSVAVNKRGGVVDRFIQDNKVRLLLGNMQAAGVGMDGLQHAAKNVAFAELAWRPGDHVQAEDRCYRIGTKDTVWAHYLIARNTIEERLCKIIQDKQAVLSATLDGGTTEEDLDVFDQLMLGLFSTRK